jgi:hypothetical protein
MEKQIPFFDNGFICSLVLEFASIEVFDWSFSASRIQLFRIIISKLLLSSSSFSLSHRGTMTEENCNVMVVKFYFQSDLGPKFCMCTYRFLVACRFPLEEKIRNHERNNLFLEKNVWYLFLTWIGGLARDRCTNEFSWMKFFLVQSWWCCLASLDEVPILETNHWKSWNLKPNMWIIFFMFPSF